MAFKMVVDTLEGLPEDVAKEYVERDGKFHIQVEGMKTQADVDKVQASLTAARTESNGFKTRLALLGDRKVEDVVVLLDRIPELEAAAAGKLDDAAIDGIVETRIKTRLAPVERERDAALTANTELTGRIGQFEEAGRSRLIHDQVRSAARKAGVIEEAIDDALMLADRTFTVDDAGTVVIKEDTGFTAGLQPADWMTDLQVKRPHWWGESVGGGAGGNRNGNGAPTANPWTAENWNMTEQGKILTANRTRAEQLAKAAGTTIGGAMPAPKK